MTARTIMPKSAKRSTIPTHVDNEARDCAIWRRESVAAISVRQFQGFNQPRIANGKE